MRTYVALGSALFSAIIMMATACAAKDPAATRKSGTPALIRGQVTYLERIALLPDAEVRVRLLKVPTDAPASVVAERTIRPKGNVPVQFELPFDPGDIDSTYTYVVDARVMSGGREWNTIEQHRVLTNGASATVSIVVH